MSPISPQETGGGEHQGEVREGYGGSIITGKIEKVKGKGTKKDVEREGNDKTEKAKVTESVEKAKGRKSLQRSEERQEWCKAWNDQSKGEPCDPVEEDDGHADDDGLTTRCRRRLRFSASPATQVSPPNWSVRSTTLRIARTDPGAGPVCGAGPRAAQACE